MRLFQRTMAEAYFPGGTLDDVLRLVIQEIIAHGDRIVPTKGEADEISGVLLEISNPRARLSRTETRGKIFSSLGELCWYLARTNALGFIRYYIEPYVDFADGDVIFGGYGPRLFDWRGINQINNVIEILRSKSPSRKAVVQLFDANDLIEEHNDVPCTCTLQFMNRHDKLHMFVYMRSNDAHWGLPHDVFCFTMLQEIVARSLEIELGPYKHLVGSLHLYTKHLRAAKRFLKEGWQPTPAVMPPMPLGNPWPAIELLLHAESEIRIRGAVEDADVKRLDPYWADLVRLLEVYRAKEDSDLGRMIAVRGRISSDVYFPFIDRAIRKLEVSRPPLP